MDENKHFTVSSEKPPKRLFRDIIGRLKLEKSLKIFKGKFSIVIIIFTVSAGLAILAVQALHLELAESESGSLFSLLFSDPGAILSYFKYFIIAVLESMPILPISIALFTAVLLMISLKFVVGYHNEISKLNKLIKNKIRVWN